MLLTSVPWQITFGTWRKKSNEYEVFPNISLVAKRHAHGCGDSQIFTAVIALKEQNIYPTPSIVNKAFIRRGCGALFSGPLLRRLEQEKKFNTFDVYECADQSFTNSHRTV